MQASAEPTPARNEGGLGLGLAYRSSAQARRKRLLLTNLVSGIIIGAAFGVAVYAHEAQQKKEKEKLRKVAFVQAQPQKPKPEPPKPKPEPPKPKPGPKSPPKKQRLKAPDRAVATTIRQMKEVPKEVKGPPQQVEEDTTHLSTEGTDDEDAGEVGGGEEAPPPGPTGDGTGGDGKGTAPPPPPPPKPKPKPKPKKVPPIFLRAGMVPPERISGDDPAFPPAAQQAGIDGTVILLMTVSAQGRVTDVKIIKNVPILGEHCARVVRSWKFNPYMVNGQAVPVIIRQPFSFKLAK